MPQRRIFVAGVEEAHLEVFAEISNIACAPFFARFLREGWDQASLNRQVGYYLS